MKKLLIPFLLLAAASSIRAADLSMDFTLGILANSAGTPIADGSLLQIIASADSTFSAPTSTNFLGNASNDILLWSGSFDSTTSGVTGAMILSLANINLTTYPVAGDYLLVRWFPSLTSSASAPGSTTYGEYGYANNNLWVAGAASSSTSYFFKTTSYEGGLNADSLGYAANTITAVPEPSSYAAIIALFVGFLAVRNRRPLRA